MNVTKRLYEMSAIKSAGAVCLHRNADCAGRRISSVMRPEFPGTVKMMNEGVKGERALRERPAAVLIIVIVLMNIMNI